MSRGNRRSGSSSPVKKYLEFKGGIGSITWYDKDTKEDKEFDSVDLILIDDLASVGGYNESTSSGYKSNLLHPYDTGKKEFKVGSFVSGSYKEIASGIWKEIKGDSKLKGSKFARNLFALADVGSGYELVKIELLGAGLSPWLDFRDEHSDDELYDNVIRISRGDMFTRKGNDNALITEEEYDKMVEAFQKNPRKNKMPVVFYATKFDLVGEVSEDLISMAEEADEKLQSYLQLTPPDEKPEDVQESATATQPEAPEGSKPDDLPF